MSFVEGICNFVKIHATMNTPIIFNIGILMYKCSQYQFTLLTLLAEINVAQPCDWLHKYIAWTISQAFYNSLAKFSENVISLKSFRFWRYCACKYTRNMVFATLKSQTFAQRLNRYAGVGKINNSSANYISNVWDAIEYSV